MNNNILSKLNEIPVKTKEWLKVNNISIDKYNIPKIKKFTSIEDNTENIKGVKVSEFTKGKVLPLNKKFAYGVGKELISQGEEEFNSAYLIDIKEDSNIEEPILIKYNFSEENSTLIDNLVIRANENSKATVIIAYLSEDDSSGYHNGICKIYGENNSEIKIIKINLLNDSINNFDSNLADIQYGGKVDFTYIDIGGANSITNFQGDLLGDTSKCELTSIYLGKKDKTIDINYIMTHKGRRTESNIITKGAIKDNSKKNFKGTIDFKRGTVKSVGQEEEYCMLLSPNAKSHAVPILLCEEDDVSGQHAASAGKINEDKLFYLMSRGLSYNEARKLIIETEFNPIINKIPLKDLKFRVLDEIKRRLVYDK